MSKENSSFNIRPEGEMSIEVGSDGSVQTSSKEAVTLDLKNIESVGIKNLVMVESHAINRIVDSVSHHVKFFGGGELRFAFNVKGQLIELTAHRLQTSILHGRELIFDVPPAQAA